MTSTYRDGTFWLCRSQSTPSATVAQISIRLGELCIPLGEVSGEVSDCLLRYLYCVRIFLIGFMQQVHGVIDKMQKKFIEFLQRDWFAPFAALISKSKCQKATLPLRLPYVLR